AAQTRETGSAFAVPHAAIIAEAPERARRGLAMPVRALGAVAVAAAGRQGSAGRCRVVAGIATRIAARVGVAVAREPAGTAGARGAMDQSVRTLLPASPHAPGGLRAGDRSRQG